MLPRLLKRLAVVSCLAAIPGCGDGGTGESGVPVSGTWDGGAIPSPGVFLNLTFTLTDSDGELAGQGTISAPGVACNIGATGTRDGASFDITMNCPGFQAWTYRGTATASLLNGRFNGSGFTNLQFTMSKQ